jgi:hypothetical protein
VKSYRAGAIELMTFVVLLLVVIVLNGIGYLAGWF